MVLWIDLLRTFDQDVVGTYRISKTQRGKGGYGQGFCSVGEETTMAYLLGLVLVAPLHSQRMENEVSPTFTSKRKIAYG